MSEIIRRHSKLLEYSIASSFISSLSLLAAVFVNTEGKRQIVLIIFGLVFWIALIIEQVMFWKANRLLKELVRNEKRQLCGRIGIFSIATTVEGYIADVILEGSLLALIVCEVFHLGESLMQYLFICLIVLSFRMHCILNGKNFRYKKKLERKEGRKNG